MSKAQLKKYYRKDLKNLYAFLVGKEKSIFISSEKQRSRSLRPYKYIVLDNVVGSIPDLQDYLSNIHKSCSERSRLVLTYYNHLWEPILNLASLLGLRKNVSEQNWLDSKDLENILSLSHFEVISRRKRMLFPIHLPVLSDLLNKLIAPLPIINNLCLTTYLIARPKPENKHEYSVSIIVPTRNEEGNIPKIIPSIPKFGKSQEIIFVEGHSKDNTWQKVVDEKSKPENSNGFRKIKIFKQKGEGKADAVKMGFSEASGDILMIYDADRTVNAKDLTKFYNVLASSQGEFANGCRSIYPQENEAMGTLNKIGNSLFSWMFTWILGQRFKDTLCGTKVLFKNDYLQMLNGKENFGKIDPFGDFSLIFGAIKQNLKIVEIPVRYKKRIYGKTNIRRFSHGWLLVKMVLYAYKTFNK